VKAQYSQVWSELRRLERAGLLQSETAGRMTLFLINPECAILPELRAIFIKTEGIGDPVRNALSGIPVKAAFVYGSFADGTADLASDVDLKIIGDVPIEKLSMAVRRLEKEIGRPVNYSVSSAAEWKEKVARRVSFVVNVMKGKKGWLIADRDAIR
jgi:predicted nucleotidyltransferase